MGERRKIMFSLRAPNSEKHTHLGTFLEPKTPKIAFSTFGQLFRSGAFWAPKAPQKRKMSSFSHFCSQKWKIRFQRLGNRESERSSMLNNCPSGGQKRRFGGFEKAVMGRSALRTTDLNRNCRREGTEQGERRYLRRGSSRGR